MADLSCDLRGAMEFTRMVRSCLHTHARTHARAHTFLDCHAVSQTSSMHEPFYKYDPDTRMTHEG